MADRAELCAFMRTLRPPASETGASFLQRYDDEFNTGAPVVDVRRGIAIDEVDGWRLTVDIYDPTAADRAADRAAGPAPIVLYLHGGAWVMGTPQTHDRMARTLADAGHVVVSVDYPRAPKWRFPAGLDGALRALRWVAAAAPYLGGDPYRIVVAGDSAGANLAAAVAGGAPGEGIRLAAAALLYGIYDFHRALPVLAGVVGGARADTQQYLPAAQFDELRDDPWLSPERAAAALPPCWIGVGADDPLAPESTALAAELTRLGREHELYVAPDSGHSFLQIPFDPAYDEGWRRLLAFLEKS